MDLGYIIHYVPDVGATVAFYETAFGLTCKFLHEGGDYAEMATGETSLAFASVALVSQENLPFASTNLGGKAPACEIGFVTEDLDIAYARAIEAGATAVVPPKSKPWGQRVSYVRDLNGFIVEICTPVRPPTAA